MAERILNTRIRLKYDSYYNWHLKNPVLQAGEIAIATVDTNETTHPSPSKMTNLPNIVLKVGDGTSTYNNLKFVSALAADVHEWAKAADKPTYGYTEITGLEAELARVSAAADTDTQYKLVAIDEDNYKFALQASPKGADNAWTTISELNLSGIVSSIKALEDKFVGMEEATVVAHVANKIAGLDNAGQTIINGEIISSVSEADGVISVSKRALKTEDFKDNLIKQSAIIGLPKTLEDINTAIGNAQSGSLTDAKAYTDDVIKGLDYNGGENHGTHKFATIVTQADGVVAADYAQPKIEDVDGLTTRLSGIDDEILKKQDQLYFTSKPDDADNKVATQTYVNAAVANLTGAMHFIGKVDSLPADGTGYNPGDIIMVPDKDNSDIMIEYVLDKEYNWQQLGHESIYELKDDAGKKYAELEKAIDDLEKKHDDEMDALELDHTNRLNALDKKYDDTIKGLDYTDQVVSKQFVTAVSEADGVIAVTRRGLATSDFGTGENAILPVDAVIGLPSALENATKAGTDAAAQALIDAKADAQARIEALDSNIPEETNKVISGFDIADGVIKPDSVKKVTLAKIATTGNVNDLIQTTGDYLIFNCGNSAVGTADEFKVVE